MPLELGAAAGDGMLFLVLIVSKFSRRLVTSRAPAAEVQHQSIRQDDDETEEEDDEARRQEVRPVAPAQTVVVIIVVIVSSAVGGDVIEWYTVRGHNEVRGFTTDEFIPSTVSSMKAFRF